MIRIFKLVLLLVVSQVAFGQAPSNYTNINGRYRWIAGMFDSTFHIPKGTSPSLRTGGSTNAGGLFYNTSDSSVYTYTGTQWIKARGSINPSDTTNKYVTQVYKKNGSDSVFYVKGGNHLFAFVDSVGSPGGGGGGKIYYFNGGVSMGTIGGLQMYELGDTANTGAAANFTRATTGNIANFITDPGKPGLVQIPAGVWSVDAWLSETGGGANHAEIWIEVEKWDGSTITTIATSPIEQITEGSTPNLYSWSVSIPTTSLTVTDRIIIQFYISNTNGKTVTLYTQNGYVGEVHTTFTTGIGAINGLTAPAQYLVTGTSGTDFNINSVTATHTFNLPTASATNRGALSSSDWTTFNSKIGGSGTTNYVSKFTGSGTIGNSQIFDNATSVGIGTAFPSASYKLDVNGNINVSNAVNYSQGGTKYGWTYATSGAMAMEGLQGADISLGTGSGAVATERMVIKNSGIVGIGITPDSMFTVAQGTHLQRGVRMSGLPSAVGTKSLRIDASGTVSVADTLTNGVSGSGTTNRVSKFTASGAIGNSSIRDSSASVALDISSQGNLGVGYVPNSWFSSVKTIQLPQGSLYSYSSPSKQLGLGLNYYADAIGAERYMENGFASIYDQVNGTHRWYTAPSGIANNQISFTSRMLLQQTGELVLGNFNSDSMLNVQYGAQFGTGVRMSGLPTAPGTRAVRINANGTLSVSDTLANGISGSGTTNYIPKFTSSSAIGNSAITDNGSTVTLNSRSMTIDAASNSFGELIYREGGSLKWNAYNDYNTDNYVLGNSGGSRLFLTQDGNLGLGVTPSAWSIISPIMQFGTGGAFIGAQGNANVIRTGVNTYFNGTNWIYTNSDFASYFETGSGAFKWFNAPSGTAGNAISFTQAMTLDASGRLGIGQTSPQYRLDVYGGARIENAGEASIIFRNNAWGNFTIGQSAYSLGGGFLSIGAASAIMTFDGTNSRVGIGTTSPAYKITTSGGSSEGAIGIERTTVGTNTVIGALNFTNNNAGTVYGRVRGGRNAAGDGYVSLGTGVGDNLYALEGGNVGIGTTSPLQTTTNRTVLTVNGTSSSIVNLGVNGVLASYIYADANGGTYETVGTNSIVASGANRIDFSTNGSERMRITSGGNVGINTQTPNINGGAGFGTVLTLLASSNYGGLEIYGNGSTNGGQLDFGSGTVRYASLLGEYESSTNGRMIFRTNRSGTMTEAMRITSGGDVGINTQTPNATFHVNGSVAAAISIKTATYTLTSSDYTVVFDLNGNATANLPNATTCSGRIYVIKINRTNVSDVLTIDPNGAQTIDGNATYDLQCQQAITIQSDGSNWRIIGDYLGGLNCL